MRGPRPSLRSFLGPEARGERGAASRTSASGRGRTSGGRASRSPALRTRASAAPRPARSLRDEPRRARPRHARAGFVRRRAWPLPLFSPGRRVARHSPHRAQWPEQPCARWLQESLGFIRREMTKVAANAAPCALPQVGISNPFHGLPLWQRLGTSHYGNITDVYGGS